MAKENWDICVEFQYAEEKLVVDAEASFAYDKVTFGVQGTLDTMDGTLNSYNVGVRLDQDSDRTYALRSQDKFNELQVAFYYKVNNTNFLSCLAHKVFSGYFEIYSLFLLYNRIRAP